MPQSMSLGRLIGTTSRRYGLALGGAIAGCDLTVPQFILLSKLWEEDRLTLTETSRRMWMDMPTTSRLVGALATQGVGAPPPLPHRPPRGVPCALRARDRSWKQRPGAGPWQ